jgi:hypothetical protein
MARSPNIVFFPLDNVGFGDPGCYGGGHHAPRPHAPDRPAGFAGPAPDQLQCRVRIHADAGSADDRTHADPLGLPAGASSRLALRTGWRSPASGMGRKGAPAQAAAPYDMQTRPLIDSWITERACKSIDTHARDDTPFFLYTPLHAGAPSDPAASGLCRHVGQWRVFRCDDGSGPPHRTGPGCHRSGGHCRKHPGDLGLGQRPATDPDARSSGRFRALPRVSGLGL